MDNVLSWSMGVLGGGLLLGVTGSQAGDRLILVSFTRAELVYYDGMIEKARFPAVVPLRAGERLAWRLKG